jgi:hypothetical protein
MLAQQPWRFPRGELRLQVQGRSPLRSPCLPASPLPAAYPAHRQPAQASQRRPRTLGQLHPRGFSTAHGALHAYFTTPPLVSIRRPTSAECEQVVRLYDLRSRGKGVVRRKCSRVPRWRALRPHHDQGADGAEPLLPTRPPPAPSRKRSGLGPPTGGARGVRTSHRDGRGGYSPGRRMPRQIRTPVISDPNERRRRSPTSPMTRRHKPERAATPMERQRPS